MNRVGLGVPTAQVLRTGLRHPSSNDTHYPKRENFLFRVMSVVTTGHLSAKLTVFLEQPRRSAICPAR